MIKTAILLCAGYAKRLYPLTENFPKPLLEIEKNKPVINYILDKLVKTDIKKVYIITNNKYYKNFLNWKNSLNYKLDIEVLNDLTNSEGDKLGAIGDLNFAINKLQLQEPLLILSGDNLYDFELSPILNRFKETNKDLTALYEEKNIELLKQMCSIELDNDNKIINFEEKPENPFSTLFSIGIYLHTKETVALIKKYIKAGNNPDQPGRFLQWLYPKKEVYGYKSTGTWFDIGTLEQLEKARKNFKQKSL